MGEVPGKARHLSVPEIGELQGQVEAGRRVELRAGDATINDHLGDAYWRVGRKLEAKYQWKRALASEPEEAEVPKIQAKIDKGLAPIEADAAKVAAADRVLSDIAPPSPLAGFEALMPANVPHAVTPLEPFKMVLVMLRSPADAAK